MGLDYVECVIAIEETFDVELSDAEMGRIRTVGDLHHYIETLRDPTESRRSWIDTWETLCLLLEDQLGVPAQEIHKETRFEDLPG